MKLQDNHFWANSLFKKVLHCAMRVCLLVLIVLSTTAWGPPSIAQANASPGDALIDIGQGLGQSVTGLAWLPDSSGFLYSSTEGFNHYANIFKYTFATGSSTRLTNYTSGYPRRMSVSLDGTQVLYEYQATGDLFDLYYDIDLYMMDNNGNGSSLFLEDAREPAWSPVTVAGPPVYSHFAYLPAITNQ